MTQQSEAQKLADDLDRESTTGRISNHTGRKAAAELRRLHEEVERKSAAIQKLWKERDEALAAKKELLEALMIARGLLKLIRIDDARVDAAIAKAEGRA